MAKSNSRAQKNRAAAKKKRHSVPKAAQVTAQPTQLPVLRDPTPVINIGMSDEEFAIYYALAKILPEASGIVSIRQNAENFDWLNLDRLSEFHKLFMSTRFFSSTASGFTNLQLNQDTWSEDCGRIISIIEYLGIPVEADRGSGGMPTGNPI